MHALGFYHEQSRYDRDEFVHVYTSNIQKGKFKLDCLLNTHSSHSLSSSSTEQRCVMGSNPGEFTCIPMQPEVLDKELVNMITNNHGL